MSVIQPCNALKNSLKLPHCVVTRFHSCCNCTLHAASINFTDLCVPSPTYTHTQGHLLSPIISFEIQCKPHIHWCNKLCSSFLAAHSCREAIVHTHRFWITKAGNTQPPTHTLLKQPTLYISSTQHTHRF